MAREAAAAGEAALDRPRRQRRRDRARLGGGRRAVRRRHRPDLRARRAGRLRARPRSRSHDARDAARTPARRVRSAARRASMADHVRAMLAFQAAGAVVFDYGNNLRAQAQEAGVDERVRLPGLRARVHPAAVLRGPRAVPLGGAVGRPGGHPAHRPRDPRAVPATTRGLRRWLELAEAQGPVPGPAGADLLAGLRRAREGRASRSTARRGGRGQGADRHRPRPPGLGLGRLAQPRDGGDEGRHRRRRRLAAAQRARQHRGRRDVGLDPPRRRRRASATASTPGWSSSRTARSSRRRSWSACSRATRGWASCATWTRATSARSRSPASAASAIPMLDP